jgi:hypothetical protein
VFTSWLGGGLCQFAGCGNAAEARARGVVARCYSRLSLVCCWRRPVGQQQGGDGLPHASVRSVKMQKRTYVLSNIYLEPSILSFRRTRRTRFQRFPRCTTCQRCRRYPGCRRSCRGCMMDAPLRAACRTIDGRARRVRFPISPLPGVCAATGKCKVCAVCARLCVVQAAQCTLMCGRLKLRARPSTPIKRRLCGELNASCFIPGVRVFYTASRRGTTKRRKSWHTHLGGGVCCFNRRSSRDWEIAARCRVVVDAAGRCCFRWMWI